MPPGRRARRRGSAWKAPAWHVILSPREGDTRPRTPQAGAELGPIPAGPRLVCQPPSPAQGTGWEGGRPPGAVSPRGSVSGHAGPGHAVLCPGPQPGSPWGPQPLLLALALLRVLATPSSLTVVCCWLETPPPFAEAGRRPCLWIGLWVPCGQECRPLTPHSVNHCRVCDHRYGRTGPLELEATY